MDTNAFKLGLENEITVMIRKKIKHQSSDNSLKNGNEDTAFPGIIIPKNEKFEIQIRGVNNELKFSELFTEKEIQENNEKHGIITLIENDSGKPILAD
jgi:hypothetical protein